jgi:hypothetical protein
MADIFISYSRKDQAYAQKLAEDMRARGFSVWIDDRIEHGNHWFDEIEQAITDARAVAVIMTPDADKSEWVRKEILLAKRDGKAIFPLLLEGREFGMLIDIQFADIRSGKLPPDSYYDHINHVIGNPFQKAHPAPLQQLRRAVQNAIPSAKGGSRRGVIVIAGLLLAAACACATLYAIATEFDMFPTGGGFNVPQGNANNFTVSGASNAQAFLSLVGQGNIGGASQYVCPQAQSYLASNLTAGLVSLGVTALSNVTCVDSGANAAVCTYWATGAAGTVTAQDTFYLENGLVCGVAGM